MSVTLTAEYSTYRGDPWAYLRFIATTPDGDSYTVREETILPGKAEARRFAKRCRATPLF